MIINAKEAQLSQTDRETRYST